MSEKQCNKDEFEILKQRYESLEKTLTNAEKEKEYYQVYSYLFYSFSFEIYLILENLRSNKKRIRTY